MKTIHLGKFFHNKLLNWRTYSKPSSNTPELKISNLLSQIEQERNSKAILFHSPLVDDGVQNLHRILKSMDDIEKLDLVLYTTGGSVNVARQIAFIIHSYAKHLSILVPYRARSAGTLLCLAANQLILCTTSELSPIDPHISSIREPQNGQPSLISAEDIHAYMDMAENWFELHSEESRLQVFLSLTQHIFPTSLSSFYRAELLTRQIGSELLLHQLPNAGSEIRDRIVEHLISGYFSHSFSINRRDAEALGLQVIAPTKNLEADLWDLLDLSNLAMQKSSQNNTCNCTGIIATSQLTTFIQPR